LVVVYGFMDFHKDMTEPIQDTNYQEFFQRGKHRRTRRGVGGADSPPALKIFRANSIFQGKRKLLKIPENKKYIFSTVNLGHPLLFRASGNSSKLLNVKSIFNTVENFRAALFFSASASFSKIVNDKKYTLNTVKIPGQLCFSGQAQLAQNSECKKYVSYSGKIQGKLCFSGQC